MTTYQTIYTQQLAREIRNTPDEYLPMLLDLVRVFRQSITLKPAAESFKQGWQEMRDGETLPLDSLWEGIDAE